MMTYEKLDAWKGCHALVLAVIPAIRSHGKAEPQLSSLLAYTSGRAAAKLAFGSGTRNRKLFRMAVARSAGFLGEFGYWLSVTRVMGVLPENVFKELDALRGRASFYTWQLLESLIGPPPRKGG